MTSIKPGHETQKTPEEKEMSVQQRRKARGERKEAKRKEQEAERKRLEEETRANMEALGWKLPAKPDLDSCPMGWDKDVWHLALYFKQVAEATTRRETLDQKICLEHGLPLIYAYLERVCDPFREWFFRRQEKIAAGEKLRPICIGSSRKDVRVAENWVQVVEQAITWHFRKYYEDEYAAETFCNPEVFRNMIRESRETAYEWHLLARHEEKK